MKVKEQTRKRPEGCLKHSFEVADRADEVSNPYQRQGEADVVWRDFRRVLNAEKLSEQEGNSHGQETNS